MPATTKALLVVSIQWHTRFRMGQYPWVHKVVIHHIVMPDSVCVTVSAPVCKIKFDIFLDTVVQNSFCFGNENKQFSGWPYRCYSCVRTTGYSWL